ncbi:hypothetical protein CARUB_v10027555mg, partial [Capsella rubella]
VAEKVAEGELDYGFAIARHHAETDEAMGFCLSTIIFYLLFFSQIPLPDLGIKKILIVDWDIHHGNGTQKNWNDILAYL